MAKFQCTICGHIHEGLEAPEKCPVCKAPSSKFSDLSEKPKSENLEKISEEDYEIIKKIEDEGFIKTIEWYKENYDCDLSEAKKTVKIIRDKYHVESKDDEEILSMWNSLNDKSKVVEWYKNTYEVSQQEAYRKINGILSPNTNSNSTSSSGCAVTLLIAITSTLSLMFFAF